MKRFIGLLLICSLAVACFAFEASAYTDVSDSTLQKAVELLKALDIMNGYEGDVFKPDDLVTRAEFAVTAARMICVDEKDTGTETYYQDVPEMHFAQGAINNLTRMGIISGDGQGNFRPDDPVSAVEAYKVMLYLTGYGTYMQYVGGYPNGCLQLAAQTDIAIDVPMDQQLTRGQVASIALRALEAPLLEPDSFVPGSASFEVNEDADLLSLYRNIYRIEGQVTAVPGTTLLAEKNYREQEIFIDGERYRYAAEDIANLIGSTVEVYYQQEQTGSEREIIYLSENTRVTDEISLSADDLISFDQAGYVLTYSDPASARVRKVNISRGASVIRNRVAIADVDADTLMIEQGTLRLKRSENSGGYDIVIIEEYENFIVGTVDATNEAAYGYYDRASSIDLNADRVRIYNASGAVISIADLKPKDVLTILDGSDNYAEVYLSDAASEGTLEEIYEQGRGLQYVIDGTAYDVDKAFLTESGLQPTVGSSIRYTRNLFGTIAYFESVSTAKFGYVVQMSRGNLLTPLKARMFTQDGVLGEFELEKKIRLNDITTEDNENILSYFYTADGTPIPQLVRFTLSQDGKINTLETVRETDDPNALRLSRPEQDRYWKINGYFAKDVIIDDQTLLFSVPKDPIGADEDEFQMLKRSSLSEAVTYTIATYKTTDKVGFEQVAVIRTDSETQSASGNVYCMVEKVTTVLNDEGDTVQCLHAYNGREQKTWYVKDGYTLPETIEIGDIVRPTLNMNDEIIFLELTYDCSGAERPIFDDETADFHQQNRIMFGYGSDLVDSVFKVSFYPDGAESFLYDITDTAIIVYDPSQPEGKQIYQGTTGDISLYSYVGSECSRLLLQSSYEHARIIYVYK